MMILDEAVDQAAAELGRARTDEEVRMILTDVLGRVSEHARDDFVERLQDEQLMARACVETGHITLVYESSRVLLRLTALCRERER